MKISVISPLGKFAAEVDDDLGRERFEKIIDILMGRATAVPAITERADMESAPTETEKRTELTENTAARPEAWVLVKEAFGQKKLESQERKPILKPCGDVSGFMFMRCPICEAETGFSTKMALKDYRCKVCTSVSSLEDVVFTRVKADCKCGSHFKYWTNIDDQSFEIQCLDCHAPMPVEYIPETSSYESMFKRKEALG